MHKIVRASTLCALLQGCAAYSAHEARTALPGLNLPELESCAGVPDGPPVQVTAQDWLLTYKFQSSAQPAFSIKVLTDLDLEIGNKGGCVFTADVREPGVVRSIHYKGTEFSTQGQNAACAALVDECRTHPDHLTLPAGYPLDKVLKAQGGKAINP